MSQPALVGVGLFLLCVFDVVNSCNHFTPMFRRAVMSPRRRLHSIQLSEDDDWSEQLKNNKIFLGQVAGVDVDSHNNLHIFHRGERAWGAPQNWRGNSQPYDLFDFDNNFQGSAKINAPCLIVLDGKTGKQTKTWGGNRFLVPHGITIDHQDNIWVTDVGSHTVHKFDNNEKELLSLGQWSEPAKSPKDEQRFCKPTDVAVSSKNNMVYVSDGYCNNRVVAYTPEGKYFSQYEIGGSDVLPHSLSIDPNANQLFVADRENGRLIRIQIADNGKHGHVETIHELKGSEKLFALHINPASNTQKGLISLLVQDNSGSKLQAFTVSEESGLLEKQAEKDMYMHSATEKEEENAEDAENAENDAESWLQLNDNSVVTHRHSRDSLKKKESLVPVPATNKYEQSFLHDLAVHFTPSTGGQVAIEFFTVGWKWNSHAPRLQNPNKVPTFVRPKVHRYSHNLDLSTSLGLLETESDNQDSHFQDEHKESDASASNFLEIGTSSTPLIPPVQNQLRPEIKREEKLEK